MDGCRQVTHLALGYMGNVGRVAAAIESDMRPEQRSYQTHSPRHICDAVALR